MSDSEWLRELKTHGYCVVPRAVPISVCEHFQSEALGWLEGFNLGFKREDRATWRDETMPLCGRGAFRENGVEHEDFMWQVRAQESIFQAFAEIWGIDDLVASYDTLNVSFPINAQHGRTDIAPTPPWPHMDQNPRHLDELQLVQGIANLGRCGPSDGGLVVLRDSWLLHSQYFAESGGFDPARDHGENGMGYGFEEPELEWYIQHGCKIVKIEAQMGDLILWDSRTVHWNASPTGKHTRFAQYVCYVPRSFMTEDVRERKIESFKRRIGGGSVAHVVPAEFDKFAPLPSLRKDPVETPQVLRAIGVRQ